MAEKQLAQILYEEIMSLSPYVYSNVLSLNAYSSGINMSITFFGEGDTPCKLYQVVQGSPVAKRF